jgi:hypothetical protein
MDRLRVLAELIYSLFYQKKRFIDGEVAALIITFLKNCSKMASEGR